MNINNMRIVLLIDDKSLVIPRLSPTIPNADVTSNNNCIMEKGTSIDNVNSEKNTMMIANNVTVTAFVKSSSYISLLKSRILSPSLAYVIINIMTNAQVVVRIT